MMQKKNKCFTNPDTPTVAKTIDFVTQHGMPDYANIIYNGRNILFRLDKQDTDFEQQINVKSFHTPRFPNNIIYSHLRDSKAKRSYTHAKRLLRLGFHTPTPYGYSEVTENGIFKSSYYFCQHLPYPNMRCWENRKDRNELIKAFGKEIARLHQAGVFMKDFSSGNILLNVTPQGEYEFYYVDLNRMDFDVHDEKRLMQMFRTLSPDKAYVHSIARAYAIAAGKSPTKVIEMANDAFNHFIKIQQRKKHMKSFFHAYR